MGDDRIWLNDTTVDGKPVKFIFDSGANGIALFSNAVRRLGLNVIKGSGDDSTVTDTYDMDWEGNSFRTDFDVLDVSRPDFDGVMGWGPISSNVVQIDAPGLSLAALTEVPKSVVNNWAQFRLMTNFGTLDLEIPHSDGTSGIITIDTGTDCGLALSASRWLQWKKAHPRSPATINTYMTLDGIISEEESWADRVRIGSLFLTNVPIMEDYLPDARQWGAKHDATLGLAALSHLEIIIDGIHSIAYLHARTGPFRPYSYNRLGADFIPGTIHSNELVAVVAVGSPAYEAGIRDGDVLLRVEGIRATGRMHLRLSKLEVQPAGTYLHFTLQRNGTNFETTAILRDILCPTDLPNGESPSETGPSPTDGASATNGEGQTAVRHLNEGVDELKNGNLNAALTNFSKAIESKPDFPDAYYDRAYSEQLKGDLDGALADYGEAIRYKSEFPEAYVNRGSVKQAKGDLDGALVDYDRAIDLMPNSAEAYAHRGFLEAKTGKVDTALADYDRAIKIDPGSADFYVNRSEAEEVDGNLGRSEADCAQAVTLNPRLAVSAADAFHNLGYDRYERLEYTNALSDFREACQLNRFEDYAHFGAWLCSAQLGHNVSATDDLRRYLAIRPAMKSGDWPSQIAQFLTDQITEGELLSAAENADTKTKSEQYCEAYFYIGSKRLVAGDKAGAVACFGKCLATGAKGFNEYQCAKAELKNLGNAN